MWALNTGKLRVGIIGSQLLGLGQTPWCGSALKILLLEIVKPDWLLGLRGHFHFCLPENRFLSSLDLAERSLLLVSLYDYHILGLHLPWFE